MMYIHYHKRLRVVNTILYLSGETLINDVQKGIKYDLIILDIYLNHNGIKIARTIKSIQVNSIFVFLTISRLCIRSIRFKRNSLCLQIG